MVFSFENCIIYFNAINESCYYREKYSYYILISDPHPTLQNTYLVVFEFFKLKMYSKLPQKRSDGGVFRKLFRKQRFRGKRASDVRNQPEGPAVVETIALGRKRTKPVGSAGCDRVGPPTCFLVIVSPTAVLRCLLSDGFALCMSN